MIARRQTETAGEAREETTMETMQSMMDARTPLEIMAARGIVPVGGVWWRCERCGEMLRAACDCCEPQTNHDCVAAR